MVIGNRSIEDWEFEDDEVPENRQEISTHAADELTRFAEQALEQADKISADSKLKALGKLIGGVEGGTLPRKSAL